MHFSSIDELDYLKDSETLKQKIDTVQMYLKEIGIEVRDICHFSFNDNILNFEMALSIQLKK